MSLNQFKRQFSVSNQGLIHLNNAGLSLTSKPAADQVRYWVERFQQEGMHCNDDYMEAAEVARKHLAKLAGADSKEVAFFQSTAGAISQVAFGLEFKASDEILVWDQEYASNLYPWKAACDRSGAKLIRATSASDGSTPLEKLISCVTDKTKLIAVSWVQFQTGAMTDIAALAEFAKSRGIWTVVDVIQGLGLLPFDFHSVGVDAVCGGSHKWLVSPVGVGFLILKKERLADLKPLSVGAMTYGSCDDPSDLSCLPKFDATRFEAGAKQVLEITALGASCKLIQACGVELLQVEAYRLAHILREGLRSQGYVIYQPLNFQQAFVNFALPPSTASDFGREQIAHALAQNKISYALRGPGLRLSPHAFNSEQDIEFALRVLKRS